MQFIAFMAVALVIIWLFNNWVVLLGLLVVGGVLLFFWAKLGDSVLKAQEAVTESALLRFWSVFEEHAEELARARVQSVYVDRYGLEDKRAWRGELEYFCNRVILPALESFPDAVVEGLMASELNIMDDRLTARARALGGHSGFSEAMSPIEYELYCAKLLQGAGWEARTTKGSGDQGVDVIATKTGRRLILQCKLYSSPVGNSAVQEAAAAKLHERGDWAAVVSNAGFTPSARQLAHSTGTLLLHHSDLPGIDARLA